MFKRTSVVHLALCLSIGLGACASRQQTLGQRIDDSTLKRRVGRALLADPQAARLGVDVDVVDAVVYLNGEVDSEQQRIQAGKVAANTVGVKEVVNELQVEDAVPDDEDHTDIGIRSTVGSLLLTDPEVRRFQIDVDVVNGVVLLTGVVEDERAKAAAERVAAGVDGVREVQNNLQVHEDRQGPAPVDEQPPATEQPAESRPEGIPPMDEPMDEPMPQD
jgi:hyperosmotically inducible protein